MSILDGMNFRALDENFDTISLVDDYESAIWTERYNGVGDFEIHGQSNAQLLYVAANASYIFNSATSTLMVIEKPRINFSDDTGNTVTLSGRSFESFLDRRVMLSSLTVLNPDDYRVSQIICNLVSDAFSDTMPARYWDALEVVNDTSLVSPKLRVDESLQFALGDNLLTTVIDLCTASGLGFKCVFLPANKKVQFVVYEGLDRTGQGDKLVVFSDLYDNLLTASDEVSLSQIKNTLLVIGNAVDEVTKNPVFPIIVGDSNWAGLERREAFLKAAQDKIVYIDANHQRDMTAAEYVSALALAGANELNSATYQSYKNFTGDIRETERCSYGTDFNLGDVILFRALHMEDTAARLDGVTFSDDTTTGKTLAPIFTYGV